MLSYLILGSKAIECYCNGECPDHRTNQTCRADEPGSVCFHHVQEVYNERTDKLEIESTYGCVEGDSSILTCKIHLTKQKVSVSVTKLIGLIDSKLVFESGKPADRVFL